jgi:hypothetical protein
LASREFQILEAPDTRPRPDPRRSSDATGRSVPENPAGTATRISLTRFSLIPSSARIDHDGFSCDPARSSPSAQTMFPRVVQPKYLENLGSRHMNFWRAAPRGDRGRSLSLDFRMIRPRNMPRTSARPYRSDRYFYKTTTACLLGDGSAALAMACLVPSERPALWIKSYGSTHVLRTSRPPWTRSPVRRHRSFDFPRRKEAAGAWKEGSYLGDLGVQLLPNKHKWWISFDRPQARHDRYVTRIDHRQSWREQLSKFVELVRHDRLEQVRPWMRIYRKTILR